MTAIFTGKIEQFINFMWLKTVKLQYCKKKWYNDHIIGGSVMTEVLLVIVLVLLVLNIFTTLSVKNKGNGLSEKDIDLRFTQLTQSIDSIDKD